MKFLRTTVDLIRASQLASKYQQGSPGGSEWGLVYRPAWLVGVNARLKRLLLAPRNMPIVVFVDGITGNAEECRFDPTVLVEHPEPFCTLLTPNPSLDRAALELKAREVAFHSVLKRNYTLWMPSLEIASLMEAALPFWVRTAGDGVTTWVDALGGQVQTGTWAVDPYGRTAVL